MAPSQEFIAHVFATENGYKIQSVYEHANGTSLIANEFAKKFGAESWSDWLGRAHDIGKFSACFQEYIRVNSGMNQSVRKMGKEDHSSAGALYAAKVLPSIFPPLAYCIAGHHSGLLDWTSPGESNMEHRLNKKDLLQNIDAGLIDKLGLVTDSSLFQLPVLEEPMQFHQWIRMLYSCLVDADYLDTEKFMKPDQAAERRISEPLSILQKHFTEYMSQKMALASSSQINQIRASISQLCTQQGAKPVGFYNLSLPTGAGKTLSSMAWALQHAITHNKDRIIIAIPYTSIITQTAEIFRNIFGEKNVIEHHSNILDDNSAYINRLATENWDAPIVITTNVQLFESLYASKPSKCRKLHNLSNSVLILDEAQMFPVEFLRPVLDILKGLRTLFHTSVLFTTATPPGFTGRIGTGNSHFQGISETIESLVPSTMDLSVFNRVEIQWPNKNEILEYNDIASQLSQYEQVLCVVNTRKEAQAIFKEMPEGTLHLSRMMCSAHIMKTIKEIHRRLAAGERVRVISTQLIEAGVDIDFPVVYRAFAGLDSIAQAAGRCNREGKMNQRGELGKVRVFNSPNGLPPGLMRKAADTLKEMLLIDSTLDYLSQTQLQRYFKSYYAKANNFDKSSVEALLYKGVQDCRFQFATAAEKFQLIDDKDSVSILIPFEEGADLIQKFKTEGPQFGLMRKLQHYSVSLHKYDFEGLKSAGAVASYFDTYILTDQSIYDLSAGLKLDNHWLTELLYI